jgi:hypothetical protein
MSRRSIEDRIQAERNGYRRGRELDRIGLQMIRAADRKRKGGTVPPLPKQEASAPRARGWSALSDLPRLFRQRRNEQ